MKNQEKFNQAFNFFKKSYAYKMGGTQTVVLPNGKSRYFDDRSYYEGRGTKYNSSIRHDDIGIVKVSRKDYRAFLDILRDREKAIQQRIERETLAKETYEKFKAKGLYEIQKNDWTDFIVLSKEESIGSYFNSERLAKTLDISIKDVELLKSEGKTYVFAKQSQTGKTLKLWHADLSCNDLFITVEEATDQEINEFNHDEWFNAPFAKEVGMTENKNHFVC